MKKFNWNKTAKWLRIFVLAGLLAWITYVSYLHQVAAEFTTVGSPFYQMLLKDTLEFGVWMPLQVFNT